VANERITEDMVDDMLRSLGYYDDPEHVFVEKQQSRVVAIRTALARASKTGKGGIGYPEFIITEVATPDIVLIVECKASTRQHVSKDMNRPVDYAVDGALHYARALSPHFTVIALAVSGSPASNRWSCYLIPKGQSKERPLKAPTGATVEQLIPLNDMIAAASFDPAVMQSVQRT